MNGADAAEDAGAAKNDCGDGVEFVASAGVGFGLAESRGVDDCCQRSDESGENVGQCDTTLDRNASVAGAFRGETNGAEGTAKRGSVDEKPNGSEHDEKNRGLSGNAEETFLAEKEKPGRKVCERVHAVSDGFGDTAKEGVCAECDDEWGKAEQRDERGVESAGECADAEGEDDGNRDGKMSVPPEFAKENGAEAEKRADGKIDAASENDRRHDESEQADFDGMAKDIAGVIIGGEAAANGVKVEPFEDEDEEQNGFVAAYCCFERICLHKIATWKALTVERSGKIINGKIMRKLIGSAKFIFATF